MVGSAHKKCLSLKLHTVVGSALALFCSLTLIIGFWPSGALGRQDRAVQSSSPRLTTSSSAANLTSALGSALASCDKGVEGSEPLSLPGTKSELKLDRCYRGRDHLVCGMNALLKETRSLIEDSGKIIVANYPELNDVGGVCAIKPDNLANDLQGAIEITNRFKVLKTEFNVRSNCAGKIEQSLRGTTLPDMNQAPELIKSMIESIEGDSKDLVAVQSQAAELAGKIDSSQKAMVTIRKIHQTMCLRDQRAGTHAESHVRQ